MNPSSGNKGVNGLAQAFVGEIDRRRSKDSALVLDFGEIQDDYSLKTNTFSIPIPVEDYHVCRQLTIGKTGDILAKTQAIGKPGSGEHDHKTFELSSIHGPVKGTIGTPASGAAGPSRSAAEQRGQRRAGRRPPAPRPDPRRKCAA